MGICWSQLFFSLSLFLFVKSEATCLRHHQSGETNAKKQNRAFDRLKLEAMPPGLRLEAGLHGIRIRIFQFNMKVSFGSGKK